MNNDNDNDNDADADAFPDIIIISSILIIDSIHKNKNIGIYKLDSMN